MRSTISAAVSEGLAEAGSTLGCCATAVPPTNNSVTQTKERAEPGCERHVMDFPSAKRPGLPEGTATGPECACARQNHHARHAHTPRTNPQILYPRTQRERGIRRLLA